MDIKQEDIAYKLKLDADINVTVDYISKLITELVYLQQIIMNKGKYIEFISEKEKRINYIYELMMNIDGSIDQIFEFYKDDIIKVYQKVQKIYDVNHKIALGLSDK